MLHRHHRGLKNSMNFGGFMPKLAKATPSAVVVGLLILGTGTAAMAGGGHPVPEIDPAMAVSAMALIGGAVLIIRGRRKK
jgi:branched-subunit amino acid transport protein AzlD